MYFPAGSETYFMFSINLHFSYCVNVENIMFFERVYSHIFVFFNTSSRRIALKLALSKLNSRPSVTAVIVDALLVLYRIASSPKASPGP